jgi:DNA polymerase III subunit gamma/tau
VSTALYRRYRPETFDEVIGQDHVTGPLKAAIANGRINHAYLFSGPRGCGKTTSARILARCLNCVEGPTPQPCGVCPSCRDLANGGPGSLDVVEIDAASHNGVDDARDLRERAVYAPARDRFKVFILDEAHMVTTQGFNALLKLVEEPPEHVKFVFATTEPEKVIGTIRSRTHHYPFRLVPPEGLTRYLEELCTREQVPVGKGVLPLVVRAGGGSVRDTLSVLDQLMAGATADGIDYQTAVALLGYTPDSLLGDIVDAFSAGDGAGVYRVVDRVIESGQDPRRFVEDLLERFRDLIIIGAAPNDAAAFMPEVPADRLERLIQQARSYGQAELSRAADLLNTGLTEMSGATSPRLQLELICARILLPGAENSRRSALTRVERLERRIGMGATGAVPPGQGIPAGGGATAASSSTSAEESAPAFADQGRPQPAAGASARPDPVKRSVDDDLDDFAAAAAAAESLLGESDAADPLRAPGRPEAPAQSQPPVRPEAHGPSRAPGRPEAPAQSEPPVRPEAHAQVDSPSPAQFPSPSQSSTEPRGGIESRGHIEPRQSAETRPPGPEQPLAAEGAPAAERSSAAPRPSAPQPDEAHSAPSPAPQAVSPAGSAVGAEIDAIRRSWPDVLEALGRRSKLARAIVSSNAVPQSFDSGVLLLGFNNQGSVAGFARGGNAQKLAESIGEVLGIQARVEAGIAGDPVNRTPAAAGEGAAQSGPRPRPSNHRRPTQEEVDSVVGPREADRAPVDHDKFWQAPPAGGPWGSEDSGDDDAEGDRRAGLSTPSDPPLASAPGEEPAAVRDEGSAPRGEAPTSAGSGAVDVPYVAVPPPADIPEPDYADFSGPDYADFSGPEYADASEPIRGGTGVSDGADSSGPGFSAASAVAASGESETSRDEAGGGYDYGDLDFLGAYADPDISFTDNDDSPAPPIADTEAGAPDPFAAIAARHAHGAVQAGARTGRAEEVQEPDPVENYVDYDPEGDIDITEAPEFGVPVVERLLGGVVIEEKNE